MARTIEQQRKQYKLVRSLTPLSGDEFDARVRATLEAAGELADVTPEQWVEAAEKVGQAVVVECERCRGTGQFITGSLNGKLVGPGGKCFRCEGHGSQDGADRLRNYWHDVMWLANAG